MSGDEHLPLDQRAEYTSSLRLAMEWLEHSLREGGAGSAGHLGLLGWSRPYPETTGYLVPTFLTYAKWSGDDRWRSRAVQMGDWLCDIQSTEGAWTGGYHPSRSAEPSVFNTAQILLGLCALHRDTGDERWLAAGQRAGDWLIGGLEDGEWERGHYVEGYQPAYYTRVAWPLLELAVSAGGAVYRDAAIEVLRWAADRRNDDGSFRDWGFWPDEPAAIHTIAYTLRGLLESARLVDAFDPFGKAARPALDRLYRETGLRRGRLPGAYGKDWEARGRHLCVTGNAQLALCFLRLHAWESDPRLLDAVCKLLDLVCEAQHSRLAPGPWRGAVPGSDPVWGKYMAFRWPNWAAKFLADAAMETLCVLREFEP